MRTQRGTWQCIISARGTRIEGPVGGVWCAAHAWIDALVLMGIRARNTMKDKAVLGDVPPRFATYPGLLWDWAHVWPLLGVPPAAARALEERDRNALHVTGLRHTFDAYRHMFAGFWAMSEGAGAYVMGGVQYVRVAKRVARYLCEAKTPVRSFFSSFLFFFLCANEFLVGWCWSMQRQAIRVPAPKRVDVVPRGTR